MRALRCAVATLAALSGPATAACPADYAATPWPAATQRDAAGAAVSRFIPPELYTGAEWTGSRELALRPVTVTRKPLVPSDHPTISFAGPLDWGDSNRPVIRRTRISNRSGAVDQVFAINERGDGLGRLEDRRAGRVRQMNECFKFPLELWKQGEERRCRGSVIKILDIDFTYQCVPHALRFNWNNESTYVFAPDRGLYAIEHGSE
jgi:hypothetical protein